MNDTSKLRRVERAITFLRGCQDELVDVNNIHVGAAQSILRPALEQLLLAEQSLGCTCRVPGAIVERCAIHGGAQ